MTLDESEHTVNPARAHEKRARENFDVPTHSVCDSVSKELDRLIEEALRCLEDTDLHGASAAVEKACAEAASSCDADGLPSYFGAYDGQEQGGHEARKGSEGWK